MRKYYTLITAFLCGSFVCGAAELYVSRDGTNNAPYANWADAATNIMWAVGAANNDDTIWVSNGVYALTNTIALAEGVTLRNFSADPALAVLDGLDSVRCVAMTHTSAVLDGFTVTRGRSATAGGIYMTGGTVTNCTVVSNLADGASGAGGGIYIMTNCTLIKSRIIFNWTSNSSANGAGIYGNGGLIQDCQIVGNSNVGPATCYGGGLHLRGNGIIRGSLIASNLVVNGQGGGARFFNDWKNNGWFLEDCEISYNSASLWGGGIAAGGGGTDVVVRCVFRENFGGEGGGIYIYTHDGLFSDCSFISNRTAVQGGGVTARSETA